MAIEIVGEFTVTSDVGPAANSYVSIADTKTSWETDPYKEASKYTDEEIGMAVITATNQLDSKYWNNYKGALFDDSYALHFPRTGLYDSRGISITDYLTFPVEFAKAVSIQAWYILVGDRRLEPEVSSIKKLKMDGLGMKEFFGAASQANNMKALISIEASDAISPYISGGSSKYSMTVHRG